MKRGAANSQSREGQGCTLYQEVQGQSCNVSGLKLLGKEIKVSKEAKYLGVVLDSKLNWRRHLELACVKVTQAYLACRRAFGSTRSLGPDYAR